MSSTSTPTLVIVPGWRDSGPGHWQSLWSDAVSGAVRVQQDNWVSPSRSAWVERLAQTIAAQDAPVVLAAHSLGCIAVTHLPEEATERIQAALLVAPADPEKRGPLADFAPTIILKAKDFATEITIFNARQHGMSSESAISREHITNNQAVRNTLIERGIRPESLGAAEDVKTVELPIAANVAEVRGA